jgi:hypothetical protein
MGAAFYIVTEREVPGLDTFVNGKALAQAKPRQFDKLARDAGVRPLVEFFSISRQDAEAEAASLGVDLPDGEFPSEQWFTAEEGLVSIRGLLARLAAHPDAIREADQIRDDLRGFDSVLSSLATAGVRWHLAVDY